VDWWWVVRYLKDAGEEGYVAVLRRWRNENVSNLVATWLGGKTT
jgi:hypothetical protein